MHKTKSRCFLVSLGLFLYGIFCLGCATTPAPVTAKSGDSDFANFLETIRQKESFPAIFASVIINGEIYSKAAVGTRVYGTENWVTIDDKFLIGSCGKAFTATLAAILIEEGHLKWCSTVRDVFPDLEMNAKWENISIRQLLSNRSGYVDDKETSALPSAELEGLFNSQSLPVDIRFIYLKRAMNHEPTHPPDKLVVYSNSGFLIAGVMLEKIEKKTFEKLMEEKLFHPLKLHSTGYGSPAAKDPISQPHGHLNNDTFKATRQDLPDFIAPMGNVATNIDNWSKFVLFHLKAYQETSKTLIESNTLNRMHRPPNSANWNWVSDLGDFSSLLFKIYYHLDAATLNYALGWNTKKENDRHYILWHHGQGTSFTAQVYADPKTKNAILLATNAKVKHSHLLKIAKAIKKYYSLQANLPIVTFAGD